MPVGWLSGLGTRLLLTIEPNKSHMPKSNWKPITKLSYAVQHSIEQNLFLPAAISAILWLHLQCTRYVKQVKGYGQRSRPPKFCVVNSQTVKYRRSRSWPRSQLWLQGIWEWPHLILINCMYSYFAEPIGASHWLVVYGICVGVDASNMFWMQPFSKCMLVHIYILFWKFFVNYKVPISPCHTLCMTGRYGYL